MDLINYVRQLLFGNTHFFNRKRRAVDDFETPVNSKIRRISTSQMSSPEDDWVSISSSSNSIKRRSGILPKKITPRQRPWPKETNSIPIDDDDDDIIEVKKPVEFEFMRKPPFKHTSTPNSNSNKQLQNGEDDVTFVKYTPPNEKKILARKRGFDYIKPNVNLHNENTIQSNNRLSNGSKKKDINTLLFGNKDVNGKLSQRKKIPSPTSGFDHSFRLDEKKKYKELLSKAAPNASMKSLLDSFAEYSTPIGKFLPFSFGPSRGKKLVEIALKSNDKKVSDFIDLTTNGKGKVNNIVDLTTSDKDKARRPTTCDRIKKVLKEADNEVVVKDSDSEVEVLPTPPSPKSDFRVEKSNSLKTFVHPSQPLHDSWIKNEIKRHGEVIEKTQKLIEEQKLNVKRFNSINDELRIKLLNEKVSDCLHIKDLLITDESRGDSLFPELTPREDGIVNNALDHRQPASETLVSKFNMNVTRQDLLTLAGLNWLNDEVINFYMNLIIERGKMDKWPKAYAMNTFFYPKIISSGQSSVKRWTRKIDIFSYDLIAIPIHLRMHWCMALIDFRKRRITYYDSMGSSNMECLKALLSYLEDEHLDKKKTEFDASDWRLINVKDIPQQMNGSDCGMFSCTFAEVLTRDGEINFSQENMPYLRRKMVLEILEGRLLVS